MSDPTSWFRLEPSARDKGLAAGLEARVHDPLWMLGRQWQFGELTADGDRGSAVLAEITAQVAPLAAYRPGGSTASVRYDPARVPLEALVEADPVGTAPTSYERAAWGLHFLRLLAAHDVSRHAAAYRTHYALTAPTADRLVDPASARFVDVVARRAPDGARLRADLQRSLRPGGGGQAGLPPQPAIPAADAAAVRAAAEAWLAWMDALVVAPAQDNRAWVPERMEYAFAVTAGSHALEVGEHTDGRLDWHAFDAAAASSGPPPPAAPATVGPVTVMPSPVAYPSMPAGRLWEFEDARVDFGGLEAEPEDLGRMLLAEFALVFGGDWLLVPLELPAGALATVTALDVRDTFGRTQRIAPTSTLEGPLGGWRMFGLSGAAGTAPVESLLLAPVLAAELRGRDLEEVLLLRDEMANLAWAVERQVEGEDGAPVDRAQAAYAGRVDPASSPPTGAHTFTYRLATDVPEHWLPLLPVRARPEDPSVGLRLGTRHRSHPRGRLLQPLADAALVLHEEEVPREGARITSGYRLTRWTDGSTHLWRSRRKSIGRGEGSAPLHYDQMT